MTKSSKRKRKEDDFFGDMVSDQEETPKNEPVEDKEINVEEVESPLDIKKSKKKNKAKKTWDDATDQKLESYVKHKDMVDIDTKIAECVKEFNIKVISMADIKENASNYREIEKLRLRETEIKRVERLKSKENSSNAINNNQEVETEFEESSQKPKNNSFNDMNLHKSLMMAIKDLNFKEPTKIQSACIPVALEGKDICGCAATGTGKTAAYLLPALDRLLISDKPPCPVTKVMVLVPTRELGVQVFQVGQALTKYTKLTISLVCGGMKLGTVKSEVRAKPDIVIATPGMLVSLMKDMEGFTLANIQILVIDEADRILDEYFADQMNEVIAACAAQKQLLLFSATMTDGVKEVASVSLTDPVKIFVNSNTRVAQNLHQEYITLKDNAPLTRLATLTFLLTNVFDSNCVVFLPTKIMCHRIYVVLKLLGLSVGELHGKLPQSARLRNLNQFATGELNVLLATDLASRGLDIKNVDTVINFQLHQKYENYVHRVGRTARAGQSGRAISLATDPEFKLIKQIGKMSKTVLYQRKIAQSHIMEWKQRLEILSKHADDILAYERAEIYAVAEGELVKQIDSVSRKTDNKQKMVQKQQEAKKKGPSVRHLAEQEGLDVQEYLRRRMLNSNKVSNSKKKDLLRKIDRQECRLVGMGKKALQKVDSQKFVNTKYKLNKRKFTNPCMVIPKLKKVKKVTDD